MADSTASSSVLPPITKEILRAHYAKYPLPTLSDASTEAWERVAAAVASAGEHHLDAQALVKSLHVEPPRQIDYNYLKVRTQCELAEVVARRAPSSVAERATAAAAALERGRRRIEKHQDDVKAKVLTMIEAFLPNDFRISAIRYAREYKEQANTKHIDDLVAAGASIEERYEALWEQQKHRRESLVQLANAEGAYKVVITYIGGVPAELLEFTKQLNDPTGPIEETRVTYAPRIYELLRAANDTHKALALLATPGDAVCPPAAHDALASAAAAAAEQFALECDAFLSVFYAGFLTSPFVVTPQQLRGGDAARLKNSLPVAAWKEECVVVDVAGGGKDNRRTVAWEYMTRENDIGFRATFTPAGGGDVREIAAAVRSDCADKAVQGSAVVEGAGKVTLHFDNTYSWTQAKTVMYNAEVIELGE